LKETHSGDIHGAFGTIRLSDEAPRRTWRRRLLTLAAIVGPGLIVMVGDNDAGGVSTYAQAGQDFGYSLLWTLLLLVPVLIVNQEMVVRLGAVTGVGQARLIKERFGSFWAWFSVGGLFLLNFLIISTEFIGVSMAGEYFGFSPYVVVPLSAILLIGITVTGNFTRWERAMFVFLFASLLVLPLAVLSHPDPGAVIKGFLQPSVQGGFTSNAALLIIAIVGTTVAPWQLFFQQSNVIDKRITPRWLEYEKADTLLGAIVVVVGAAAIMMAAASAFTGTSDFGHYKDALGLARGLRVNISPAVGAIFAPGPVRRIDCRRISRDSRHVLRVRRHVRPAALLAPGHRRREAFLRFVCRDRCCRGRHRSHPSRAAWLDHDCGPGARWNSLAQLDGIRRPAVQRPRCARPVGQPAVAEPAGRRHRQRAPRPFYGAGHLHCFSVGRREPVGGGPWRPDGGRSCGWRRVALERPAGRRPGTGGLSRRS